MEKKCLKKITLIYRYFGVEISFYTSLGVWMPKLILFIESCCCLPLSCVPFSQLSFSSLPHLHPLARHPVVKIS